MGQHYITSCTNVQVGYLATKYKQSPLIVFDYAKGGETTHDLRYHLEREFLPQLGDKPEFAPWGERDSLFGMPSFLQSGLSGWPEARASYLDWDQRSRLVRVQDQPGHCVPCAHGRTGPQKSTSILRWGEYSIYKEGCTRRVPATSCWSMCRRSTAVPEVPRPMPCVLRVLTCPVPARLCESWKGRYEGWNAALDAAVSGFASAHADATVFVFSAWDTFTRMLDDPVAHGFERSDARKRGGAIWVDELHPTSAVHGIVAEELARFLASHGG